MYAYLRRSNFFTVTYFQVLHFQLNRASGDLEVTWEKLHRYGGSPKAITDGARYKKLLNGRRLEITNPTFADDNGIYKCIPTYGLTSYKDQAKEIELVVSCKVFY